MAITVTNAEQGETRVYQVPVGAGIIVQNGDHHRTGTAADPTVRSARTMCSASAA